MDDLLTLPNFPAAKYSLDADLRQSMDITTVNDTSSKAEESNN